MDDEPEEIEEPGIFSDGDTVEEKQVYKKTIKKTQHEDNSLPIIEGIDNPLEEARRLNTVLLLSDLQELGTDIELAYTALKSIWTEEQRNILIHKRKYYPDEAYYTCFDYFMKAGEESRNAQTVLFSLKLTLNRLAEKIKIVDVI